MTPFEKILDIAEKRSGGSEALAGLMPETKSPAELQAVADDRYFSRMSFRVFAAGLKHSMVEGKWPAFEEVFLGFDPRRVRALNDEELEALMGETRIIRHWGKIRATHHNAAAICDIVESEGSFGAWLAAWPAADIVGLWEDLTKRFKQLGGMSGPYFLRMVGKDTFVLTKDVVKALNQWGAYDGEPKGKRAKREVQDAINAWAAEPGRPTSEVSRVLALSVD